MGERRNKKKQEKRKKALKNRFAKNEPTTDEPLVLIAPPGEVKMSEVVWDFIEPYKGHWRTEDQLRRVLSVALVAWNAAISSPSRQADLLDKTAATLSPDARDDYLEVVMDMIKRKNTYFAANKRMIIDYQLVMTDDGPHLSVISTLEG